MRVGYSLCYRLYSTLVLHTFLHYDEQARRLGKEGEVRNATQQEPSNHHREWFGEGPSPLQPEIAP